MENKKLKDPKEMTDQELLEAYRKGKIWLEGRMQVSRTNKNENGNYYDPLIFMAGLQRLQKIEDILRERSIKYD